MQHMVQNQHTFSGQRLLKIQKWSITILKELQRFVNYQACFVGLLSAKSMLNHCLEWYE